MSLPVDVGISIDSLVFKTESAKLDVVVAMYKCLIHKRTGCSFTMYVCISYDTGKSALPDIYTRCFRACNT